LDYFLFLGFNPNSNKMSLDHCVGNTLTNSKRPTVANPIGGVEVDYYFMASTFSGSKTHVNICLWTVVVDSEGYVYGMYTKHIGHFETWKDVIRDRIAKHLFSVGVDNLQTRRLIRDIEIKKDGHLIPYNYRIGGNRIGIDGSDELYIRKDRFTFL
jgi:hypothetical protein